MLSAHITLVLHPQSKIKIHCSKKEEENKQEVKKNEKKPHPSPLVMVHRVSCFHSFPPRCFVTIIHFLKYPYNNLHSLVYLASQSHIQLYLTTALRRTGCSRIITKVRPGSSGKAEGMFKLCPVENLP